MGRRLTIPHRQRAGLCPVNGIRDLIDWRFGRDWSNEFVYGLGQGCGFACLRFSAADPPRQVYWGIATPRQHRYLNCPPDLEGNHLTAGRDLYITFLQEAGAMAGLDFSGVIGRLRESMAAIPELAEAIRHHQLEDAAASFARIAEVEAEAYTELSKVVSTTGPPAAA